MEKITKDKTWFSNPDPGVWCPEEGQMGLLCRALVLRMPCGIKHYGHDIINPEIKDYRSLVKCICYTGKYMHLLQIRGFVLLY